MSHREKDQADFDLETFVDLFDTAMSSDNPAVQRALKNLLMIAAIVNAEDTEAGMCTGPLRRVIDDQKNIIRRLDRVENEKIYPQQPTPWTPGTPTGPVPLGPYFPSNPTTIPGTTTTWPPPAGTFPPGTIWATSSNTTNISSTAHEDQFKSYDALFEKLETKQ